MPATLTAPGVDARVAAFCALGGAEVFGGVVHGSQIWTPDPLDVASIHAPAREAFSRLLARASGPDLPPTGKTLLLLGEARAEALDHLELAEAGRPHGDGEEHLGHPAVPEGRDEPVLAELLEDAGPRVIARRARSLRPTLRTTTGLPTAAARSSAAT